MQIDYIRAQLNKLADRDWPEHWGPTEAKTIKDFYGWGHRYRLEDPLDAWEVEDFERIYGIALPEDYRQFLIELGNGGAGPDHGIYPLAELEDDQVPLEILLAMKRDFKHRSKWNGDAKTQHPTHNEFDPQAGYYAYDIMEGAVPIATHGCAIDYWLVITGKSKGEIWIDKRTDGLGVEPVTDNRGQPMSFKSWYMNWLKNAVQLHGVANE